ncbi:retrovirus-related pol polyprotein from transposon TNT 1-94 [Tanacetum coccineum]
MSSLTMSAKWTKPFMDLNKLQEHGMKLSQPFFNEYKFVRGKIDNTLFVYKTQIDVILVQIYVDDIIFWSTSIKLCKQFAKLMTQRYEMSMMGVLTYFLEFQIKQSERGILINQEKYVKDLLKKYDINGSSMKTPMVPPNNLGPDLSGKALNETQYRGMIGSLMYLTASRPDIQFSTCLCARYQANPKESHLIVVKRISRYLKGTPSLGLWYPKCSCFDLKGYSDSDYAGCNMDRKSTSDACQLLGAEAEYVPIFCDNTSAIAISNNPVLHSRTKHIDIRYHFIRDHILKGDIELHFIPTQYQLADIFTKPLDKPNFKRLIVELVVGEMHKEAQQVAGGPTSLGATSEEGAQPQLSSDKIKSAGDGLKTTHTNSSANEESIADDISLKVKLEDLSDILKDTISAFFTPDSPPDEPIIISDESEEEEEVAKDKDTEATSHDSQKEELEQAKAKAEAEVASMKAKPSYLDINQLIELLIKELKKHVRDMEIEMPGDLKQIPTKLETFTSTISNLSSHVAELKNIQWELPAEFLNLPSQVCHHGRKCIRSYKHECKKLGIEVVEQYHNKKLLFDKYCDKMLKRKKSPKITNYEVLTKKGPITLKIYREDRSDRVISNLKTRLDQLTQTEQELKIDLNKPLKEQDPLNKLNELANKKRKRTSDLKDIPASSASALQVLRRLGSIFTSVYETVQKLKKDSWKELQFSLVDNSKLNVSLSSKEITPQLSFNHLAIPQARTLHPKRALSVIFAVFNDSPKQESKTESVVAQPLTDHHKKPGCCVAAANERFLARMKAKMN